MNDKFAEIQSAANAGAFGINGYALPTVEQCRAGNYRKGRVKLYGLDIAIETPQGTRRMGKSDGQPWSVICMAHYGDISGTLGADGDPVDCYVGPVPESTRVFVVNQNGKSGAFDEHKVMLAFPDEESARTAYMLSYERGWTGLGSIVSASVDQFTWWLRYGNTALPFSKTALPYNGDDDMNELLWDSAAQPVDTDLATVMYGLRRDDTERLLLDAVSMADIHEDAESLDILDALVVESQKLETKLSQLQRIMEAAGGAVKPVAMQISQPFRQKGTTNVVALYELSDGQTVAIFFHNPDSTPNKILPQDELVSWKWLLNKKDVTILVAPEKGRDLNPREVARRIMVLAEKNSVKFTKANGARAERMAAIEQAKEAVAGKEGTLAALEAEIADLTVKVEAKRAIQPPAPGDEQGGAAPESFNELARRLVPAEFVADIDPDGFKAMAADGYGIRMRMTGGGRMLATYIIQPGITGQNSLGAKSVVNGLESAMSVSVSTAVQTIARYRISSQPIDILQLAEAMKKVDTDGMWYNDPVVNDLVNRAKEQGYAFRNSTTQAGWTTAGIEALKAARAAQEPVIDWAQAQELDTNEAIRGLGVARINDIGSENVYVEKDGKPFMFKPGNTDAYAIGEHDFSNDATYAVAPEPSNSAAKPDTLSQVFTEWLDAEWADSRYRLSYLEDHGDEQIAKYANASGGGTTEQAARQQYQSELLAQPRDASIDLRVYDQYEGQPDIQNALSRHFFDLDSRLRDRSGAQITDKMNSPEELAKQARISAITAELAEIAATVDRTKAGTKADQDRQKRITRLEGERRTLQNLPLGEYPGATEQTGDPILVQFGTGQTSDHSVTTDRDAWMQKNIPAEQLNTEGDEGVGSVTLEPGTIRNLYRTNDGHLAYWDMASRAFLSVSEGDSRLALNLVPDDNAAEIAGVEAILKSTNWVKRSANTWDRGAWHVSIGDGSIQVSEYQDGELVERGAVTLLGDEGGTVKAIEGIIAAGSTPQLTADEQADADEQAKYQPFDRSKLKLPTAKQLGMGTMGKIVVFGDEDGKGWSNGSILDLNRPKLIADAITKYYIDDTSESLRQLSMDAIGRVVPKDATLPLEPIADYSSTGVDMASMAKAANGALSGSGSSKDVKALAYKAVVLVNQEAGKAVLVDARYFAYFDKIYKQPDYYVGRDGAGAVLVKKAGNVVGVISPMKGAGNELQRAARAAGVDGQVTPVAQGWDTNGLTGIMRRDTVTRESTGNTYTLTVGGQYGSGYWFIEVNGKQIAASPSGDHQSSFASLRAKGLGALQSHVTADKKKAELAPQQDDKLATAIDLLKSVIDGSTDMDAGLADRLQAVHDEFAGNAEFDALFEQAAQAFADAMVAKARTALAA